MNEQVGVDATWLLGWVAGVASLALVGMTQALHNAWKEVKEARIAAQQDRESLTKELVALKAQVAQHESAIHRRTKIFANLRQLSAAADQFYLEKGVRTARLSDLVGESKFIHEIVPVAGERYDWIRFEQGHRIFVQAEDGELFAWPQY
jgi:hypothetical protein